MEVKDIMTQDLVCIFPEDSFEKIQTIFTYHSFHHIPVIDKTGKLVGIISKMDYLLSLKIATRQGSGKEWIIKYFKELSAKHIMSKNPIVMAPQDRIDLAAEVFMTNKFHALPIIEDHKLVGLVTSHDLIQHAYQKV